MPHVNKKTTSEKWKFGSNKKLGIEWTKVGLEKHLKNPIKNKKNSKLQSEIPACRPKTTSEWANFCSNTVFYLYFKIRAKKFHGIKPLAFLPYFLIRRDENQVDFKIHENVWTDLKKSQIFCTQFRTSKHASGESQAAKVKIQ